MLGSLIGSAIGFLGSAKQSSANKKAVQQTNALNALEAQKSREQTERWNQIQYDFAREQYNRQVYKDQKGLQERVADAKAAGLHPLFALGAQLSSSSPVNFIAGQSPTGSAASAALDTTDWGTVGQGIGNAVSDYQSKNSPEAKEAAVRARRVADLQERLLRAQVSKAETEAAKEASDLAVRSQAAVSAGPPALTFPGGKWTPEVRLPAREVRKELERRSLKAMPSSETGATYQGTQWYGNPRTPGEWWEDQYGDVVSIIPHALHFLEDLGSNLGIRLYDAFGDVREDRLQLLDSYQRRRAALARRRKFK